MSLKLTYYGDNDFIDNGLVPWKCIECGKVIGMVPKAVAEHSDYVCGDHINFPAHLSTDTSGLKNEN